MTEHDESTLPKWELRRHAPTGDVLCWFYELTKSPHPSGLSRWWNDPEQASRGREFWSNIFLGI